MLSLIWYLEILKPELTKSKMNSDPKWILTELLKYTKHGSLLTEPDSDIYNPNETYEVESKNPKYS